MKKFMIPAISLAALAASGFAVAQTTEQPTGNEPTAEQCAMNPQMVGCPGTTGNEPAQPNDMQGQGTTEQQQTTEQPDVAEQPPVQVPADLTVTSIDASKAVLASRFIGSTVYSSTNENVGDINDVVFDNEGKINAAVLGVGGFLGMGEKDVAVPLEKITVSKDENGVDRYVIAATREQLDAAPAFDKTRFAVSDQTTAPAQ